MCAKPVLIIAEAGVNHNGDFQMAKELVRVAADSGADYVKFQTYNTDKLVTKTARKADYQRKNLNDESSTQYEMLKKLEMSEAWHYELNTFASEKGIKFLSTGFDEQSVEFLAKLNIPFFKIPSGEIINKRYLQLIASKNKPVFLSTGMATLAEIKDAITVLINGGLRKDQLTVLHCNTEYPTPMKDVNLLAMKSLERELQLPVGYSDHTEGVEIAIAAVALGACVIEKHFTLDRTLPGPDHKASIEPKDLKYMVKAIRNIEQAIQGSGEKHPSESEIKNIPIARKSIHLRKSILRGEKITEDHLIMKRPGDGISPMDIDQLIGCKTKVDLFIDQKLLWEQFEK